MKKLTVALAAVAMMFMAASCGGNKNGEKAAAETEVVADSVLEVDDVLSQADSLVGKDIKIEGVCTHICQHGGGKIFLMGSDSTKMVRVMAGDFKSFDKECVNSIVSVEGKLVEQRIDEAFLVKWEEQMKANQCEEQKHGEKEGGCETSKKANGVKGSTIVEQIAEYREKIKNREEKEGKAYLSNFFVEATKYEIK